MTSKPPVTGATPLSEILPAKIAGEYALVGARRLVQLMVLTYTEARTWGVGADRPRSEETMREIIARLQELGAEISLKRDALHSHPLVASMPITPDMEIELLPLKPAHEALLLRMGVKTVGDFPREAAVALEAILAERLIAG